MIFSRSVSVGTKPLPPKPTAIGLGLVGILLLVAAGFLASSAYNLQQTGIRVQAEVVALERRGDAYFPVFVFKETKGREVTVRSSVSSKSYLVGDPIPALYDPTSPLDAEVDDAVMLYFPAFIIAFIGSLFLLGMFAVWKLLPFFERAYENERFRHRTSVGKVERERAE
jgi:hypothetical protein